MAKRPWKLPSCVSEGDGLQCVPDFSPRGFFSLTLCKHFNDTELRKLWQAIFGYRKQVYNCTRIWPVDPSSLPRALGGGAGVFRLDAGQRVLLGLEPAAEFEDGDTGRPCSVTAPWDHDSVIPEPSSGQTSL